MNHYKKLDFNLKDAVYENVEAPEAAKQTQGTNDNQQQDTNTTMTGNQNITAQGAASIPQSQQSIPASVLAPKSPNIPEDLKPSANPVDGEQLANEIHRFIRTHCILPDGAINAVVLWVLSCYIINTFRVFPKLTLISPEKRCGKTTTMEVIQAICLNALLTSNVTSASIYRLTRVVEQPTLLIDEADTYVKGGDRELIGILNSGHTQSSAYVMRCSGDDHTATMFSTWMPMVLASIGDLGPTLMDRSIVINLRRKKAAESVKALPVDAHDRCKPLRERIYRWCIDNQAAIKSSETRPPNVGNDRAIDNWTPLFRVAEALGKYWMAACEDAYRQSTAGQEKELPTQLLSDIREIWDAHSDDRMTSQEIIAELRSDDLKPWNSCSDGKPISPRFMARLLRPYEIEPKVLRFSSGTLRGYERNQFEDAFERYLE